MSEHRKRPFGGLRPPAPPTALLERTLAAAREAAAAEPRPAHQESARSLTDRLWKSRPLRYAWAGLCAALLAVNLYLDRGAPGEAAHPPASRPPGTLTLLEAHVHLLGELAAAERRPGVDRFRRPAREDRS